MKPIKTKLYNFMEYLENKYNIESYMTYNDDLNTIILSSIVLPKDERNKSLGTKIMKKLIDIADRFKANIALKPTDDYGSDLNRLIDFIEDSISGK